MNGYKKMVVIFVDLMGTKNNKKFSDKYLIHKLFHGEAKSNEERNLKHVIYERKVFSFSDCAYFFYYYKEGLEENRKNDMNLLQIAMFNTSISLLRILNAGYLVRGGITIGDAYFDELGFFGPAVEKAFELESKYADIPIIALEPELGKKFYGWEKSNTSPELIDFLYTSRPSLVEYKTEKYFLNLFYQLEVSPSLHLEQEIINIECITSNLMQVILRDKEKYKDNKNTSVKNKSSIYDKLDWFENYIKTKSCVLKSELSERAFSSVYKTY